MLAKLLFELKQIKINYITKSQKMVAEFEKETVAIGAKQDVVAEGAAGLRSSLERGMEGLRAHNRAALARHLKAAVKAARCFACVLVRVCVCWVSLLYFFFVCLVCLMCFCLCFSCFWGCFCDFRCVILDVFSGVFDGCFECVCRALEKAA